MKKIICVLILIFFVFQLTAYGEKSNYTYEYILKEMMPSDPDGQVKKGEVLPILNELFLKEFNSDDEDINTVEGFLRVLSENGLPIYCKASRYENELLSYNMLFDICDYYFSDIIKAHGYTVSKGEIAKTHGSFLLTYGNGNVVVLHEDYGFVNSDANVICSKEKIIEVVPLIDEVVPPYALRNVKKIEGKFFVFGQRSIYIDDGKDINRYFVDKNACFLGNNLEDGNINSMLLDKNIVIYTGDYRKYLEIVKIVTEGDE